MALHTIVEHDTTHIKPYVDKVKQALSDLGLEVIDGYLCCVTEQRKENHINE